MSDDWLADVALAVFMLIVVGLVLYLVLTFHDDAFNTPPDTLPPL